MITVIDMTSGELIFSSTSTDKESTGMVHNNDLPMPMLALQEVQPETVVRTLPPELANIPVTEFLTQFD